MKDTVVRVITTSRSGERHFGTGVFVSKTDILTAKHVAADSAESDISVEIESRYWRGIRVADEVIFAEQVDVDLALLRLHPPKSVPQSACALLTREPHNWINVGDVVTACGFSAIDQDLECEALQIVAVHGNAGAYVFNKIIPKGFSGGPVFIQDTLVGIMYARQFDQGRSYFYSGHALAGLLSTPGVEIAWQNTPPLALRQFPLGPAVSPGAMLSALHRVIDAYNQLHPAQISETIVARANEERIACGPPTGSKGLIDVNDLPNPYYDKYSFWSQAFKTAGLKSPRMLAALLRVVESEQLSDMVRKDRDDFLLRLKTWGKQSQ